MSSWKQSLPIPSLDLAFLTPTEKPIYQSKSLHIGAIFKPDLLIIFFCKNNKEPMAENRKPWNYTTMTFLLILLVFLCSSLTTSASNEEENALVKELINLRESSPDGVIHLDDTALKTYAVSAKPPRPYSLVIFFDAADLRKKPELRLDLLRSEFALAAQAYEKNNKEKSTNNQVFFCDIEFKQSQKSFQLFGVNTLPHIRHLSPTLKKLGDSESMDQAELMARSAESIASFVETKARVKIGAIERPPPLTRNQMLFIVSGLLLAAPFLIKRFIEAKSTPLNDSRVWMVGVIFVYMFSVSGTMHNVIRKMPLFMADREDPSKAVFFYQGSGVQLGVEGFAVGGLYTIVGLLLALGTHGVVKVKSAKVQRVILGIIMLVSVWAVRKVIYLDNWKTGYAIHGYWPSSWN